MVAGGPSRKTAGAPGAAGACPARLPAAQTAPAQSVAAQHCASVAALACAPALRLPSVLTALPAVKSLPLIRLRLQHLLTPVLFVALKVPQGIKASPLGCLLLLLCR